LTSGTLEERAKQAAREEFAKMWTPEQKAYASTHHIELREKAKKSLRDDCTDGHCQQIVSEENLARYLSEGWKVVATLPSGKIVVDR
jgi:hypothetical protein